MYGQWAHNYVAGQIARSQELADQFLEVANSQPEIAPRVVGHRMVGTSSLVAGSTTLGMRHLEQAWALFDRERDAGSGLIYGQDIGAAASNYLGLASVLRGFPEQARDWGYKAVDRARDVKHVNTMAYALLHASLAAYVGRDRTTLEQHLGQLTLLTDEHFMPVWRASGFSLQGAVLGWQGNPQEGLVKVDQGIEMMASLQFKLFMPVWSLVRAELLTDLGRSEDALAAIADGLATTAETGEHWGDAELHRVRGELLLSQFKESDAEAAFTMALNIAREQGAKWWELRAATSLARLWQQQVKLVDARNLVSEIYGWFTEGFDTADLKEANALLDELAL